MDPDDARFMAVAGTDIATLGGLAVVMYVGILPATPTFEVGVFDGDTSTSWDSRQDSPVVNFKLFRDPLKNGTSANLAAQWTSEDSMNDDWYTKTLNTDDAARAPSGNFFYRLDVNWASTPQFSFNNFKVRTTGQISLRAGQEFGFTGGPQRTPFPPDPCPDTHEPVWDPPVGRGDPNPGTTNDFDANSYNGDWSWFFYVPTLLSSIAFRDGDSDRTDDEDTDAAPDDDGTPYGSCAHVSPSIYYTITDPPGHVFTNNNPSGNQEWEDFTIGPNAGDDVVINYTLQPGLWRLRVIGQDAHNFNLMRANFEIYSTTDPPLTVNPTPEVEPDNARAATPGITLDYGHNVTNRGTPNSYALKATSTQGWTTRIYHDTNGNGKVDAGEAEVSMTPTLLVNESYPIVVQVDVPSGLPQDIEDVTTILASSRTEWAVQDDAKDTTTVDVNQQPNADTGGPYTVPEGTAISFNAGGSTDPDGDALTFRWDFDGDGVWDTNFSSDPTATYTFGDDWVGQAQVEVSDGELTDVASVSVTVTNVAPSIAFTLIPSGDEAQSLAFEAQVTDPGSDDLEVSWFGACTGWTATTYANDPNAFPDPDPSPDVHPRDVTDAQTVVCGDDGTFFATVLAGDDDGGASTLNGTFHVSNVSPGLTIPPPAFVTNDEGVAWTLTATALDVGSDDLTFTWTWEFGPTERHTYYNDGAGADPDPSPGGTFPFAATDSSTHTYGDDSTYSVTLLVEDDDGGSVQVTTSFSTANLPPAVTISPPSSASTDEGTLVTLEATAQDPGSDDLTFSWDWELGPTEVSTHFNDGVGADPDSSPGGTFPFTATDSSTHTYGDDGTYVATLLVEDDDGGAVTTVTTLTINNLSPTYPFTFCPQIVGCDPARDEGELSDFWVIAEDAGSDDLSFPWSWGDGSPGEGATYFNDGIGPDTFPSPDGTYPFTATDTRPHIYADDGDYLIQIDTEDDDGGATPVAATVTILNVPPTVATSDTQGDEAAPIAVTATFSDPGFDFAPAGTREDFTATIAWGDGSVESVAVTEVPGGPGVLTTGSLAADHVYGDDGSYTAIVTVCDDDGGCIPATVIVTVSNVAPTPSIDDATQVHERGLPANHFYPLEPIAFDGSAVDVGSDDLKLSWSWGDRTPDTVGATHFNDGVGPDPDPSPGGTYPFAANDVVEHTYRLPGDYVVTLTAADDDGGVATASRTIHVTSAMDLKNESIVRIRFLKQQAMDRQDWKFLANLDDAERYVLMSLGYADPYRPDAITATLGADVSVSRNEGNRIDLRLGPSWTAKLPSYNEIRVTWANGVVTTVDLPANWPSKSLRFHDAFWVDLWRQDLSIESKKDGAVTLKVYAHDASMPFSLSLDADAVADLAFAYEVLPWWIDAAHLGPEFGASVFLCERAAVDRLVRLEFPDDDDGDDDGGDDEDEDDGAPGLGILGGDDDDDQDEDDRLRCGCGGGDDDDEDDGGDGGEDEDGVGGSTCGDDDDDEDEDDEDGGCDCGDDEDEDDDGGDDDDEDDRAPGFGILGGDDDDDDDDGEGSGNVRVRCRLTPSLWSDAERATLDAECDAIANLLVKADEMLAQVALADARETPVNDPANRARVEREIARADASLAEGIEEWSTHEYRDAICEFLDAWIHAQRAIKLAQE